MQTGSSRGIIRCKEYKYLETGTLVQLYENPGAGTKSGYVMVSLDHDPSLLYDVPEGTYALMLENQEDIGHFDDEEPVAKIFWDGKLGYVHLSSCFEI